MDPSLVHSFEQRIRKPEPTDGEVVDIDTGYEQTIVLTVDADDGTYYEEYELTEIRTSKP